MITNDSEKWHYLAVETFSALFRGIISINHGDVYCLNCLHSYRTKETLKNYENLCNNHDYYHEEMPNASEKNIKIQPRRKIIKSFVCDLCRLRVFVPKNIDSCQNNPENSFTKKAAHLP